jgi:hypothetical protein
VPPLPCSIPQRLQACQPLRFFLRQP